MRTLSTGYLFCDSLCRWRWHGQKQQPPPPPAKTPRYTHNTMNINMIRYLIALIAKAIGFQWKCLSTFRTSCPFSVPLNVLCTRGDSRAVIVGGVAGGGSAGDCCGAPGWGQKITTANLGENITLTVSSSSEEEEEFMTQFYQTRNSLVQRYRSLE